jgi:hypothetical protein
VLRIRIRDFDPWMAGSGSGIRDGKNPDPGSGINSLDLIFENFVVFGLKIHKILHSDPDPGSS